MSDFRIENDSPLVDLRPGKTFNQRASGWLRAAQSLLNDGIRTEREAGGDGEEVSLLLTNRQADHLEMGLGLLASRMATLAE